MSTDEVYKLIEDYIFAFSSKKEALDVLFNGEIDSYKELEKEEIEKLVNKNIITYFSQQFQKKKLVSIIKKYIRKNKNNFDEKDINFFDNLIINCSYELTIEEVSKLSDIKEIKDLMEKDHKIKGIIIEAIKELEEDEKETIEEVSDKNSYFNGDIYSLYNKDISKYKVMSAEQEIEYFRRYKEENDREAFDILVLCNQGLCKKVADKYIGRGLPKLDLIQEGNIGLMKAIEKFDPNLGFKLSTYSMWWIRQAIKRALYENSTTIRIPNHMRERQEKIALATNNYEKEYSKEPSIELLSTMTGLTKKEIKEAKKYDLKAVSFDKKVQTDEDDSSTLGDFIQSEIESPEELAMNKTDSEVLESLLERLCNDSSVKNGKRLAQIMRLRYGSELYNAESYMLIANANIELKDKYTLVDVGIIFGVTRERIRQLEEKTIRHLKRYGYSYKKQLDSDGRKPQDDSPKKKIKTKKKKEDNE